MRSHPTAVSAVYLSRCDACPAIDTFSFTYQELGLCLCVAVDVLLV